jgi:rhamnulose-1-phosphate aldolase
MKMTDTAVLQKVVRTCNDAWLQGWHERNGGNLSYRLSEAEVEQCRPFFQQEPGPWVPMPVTAENLAGEYFVATGSGKYMRNVLLAPQNNLCLLQISQNGDARRIVWGLENGGVPTSEFPSHFLNHSVRKTATDGACRVIYHAHPANIIAMTFLMPLSARDFTRALWRSMTECPVVFPGGVGVVKWMVPGGAEIAYATSELMREYDAAIWAHHGVFVSGPDLDTAFGLMHTIEKSAEIYMKVLTSGQPCLQTITDDDLRAIASAFHVSLREEFLTD